MKFIHRLGYYLVGVLVGSLFLKFVLDYTGSKGLDFCYLPNCRVLKNIRNKPFDYSEISTQKLAEKWIDTTEVKNILTNGDVDFSKSNKPFKGGKLYVIKGVTKKFVPITLEVVNYDEKAILKDIIK